MTPTGGVWRVAVVAAAYAGAARLAQEMIYTHNYVCALWPAAGVGLVAVLWYGRTGALGVWLGSFLGICLFFSGELAVGSPGAVAAVAAVTGAGAAAEAVLAARVVRRLGTDRVLDRFSAQILFVTATFGCSAVSATVGVTASQELWRVGTAGWWEKWALWAVGDTLGALLVAPLLLSVRRWKVVPGRSVPGWVACGMLGLAVGLTFGLFAFHFPNLLLFPVLLACFYLHQRWALAVGLAIALAATTATARGLGPLYVPPELPHGVLYTQFNLYPFILAVGSVALAVSGGLEQRVRRSELVEEERDARRRDLQLMTDLSPIGIGWVAEDPATEDRAMFVDMNEKLAQEFYYNTAAEMRAAVTDPNRIYARPADRQRVREKLAAPGGVTQLRFEARGKNDRPLWVELDARRITRDGTPLVLGFARNVTNAQRRLTELQLYKTVKEVLKTSRPSDPWLTNCLEETRREIGAAEVVVWLLTDRESGRVEPYAAVAPSRSGPHRQVPTAPVERFEHWENICQFERDRSGATSVYRILDEATTVGLIVAHEAGWLFADPGKASDLGPGEDPLERVLTGVGQMLFEAHRRDVAEERNSNIARLAPVGIFYSDATGANTYLNEEGRKIQGMDGAKVEAPGLWFKHLDGPDERRRVQDEWEGYVQKVCATPHAEHPDYQLTQWFRVGIERRKIQARARPVVSHGEVTGFVGVVTDVTGLTDEKDKLAIQLHRINHNARNALVPLKAALKDIARPGASDADIRACAERALSCHDEIAGLADVARSKDEWQFNPHQLAREHAADAARAKKTLVVDGTDGHYKGPRYVYSDVLGNLLANAFAQEQVSTVWVDLKFEPGMGNSGTGVLTVTVRDDGLGLGEHADVLKLSDRDLRQRVLARGDGRGRGRGLALCQLSLRELTQRELVPPGDADELELRALQPSAYTRHALQFRLWVTPAAQPRKPLPEPLGCRGPVLVVEDQASARAVLGQRLLTWGIDRLVVCGRGEDAAAVVKGMPPDYFKLVLLDLQLDGTIDGYETAELIRNHTGDTLRIVSISVSNPDAARKHPRLINSAIEKGDLDSTAKLNEAFGLKPPTATPSAPSAPAASVSGWCRELSARAAAEALARVAAFDAVTAFARRRLSAVQADKVADDLAHILFNTLEVNWCLGEVAGALEVEYLTNRTLTRPFEEMLDAVAYTYHRIAPTAGPEAGTAG